MVIISSLTRIADTTTEMKISYFNLTFLLLVTLFFSQVFCIYLPEGDRQQPSWMAHVSDMKKMRYCNGWAVEIHGGSEMADQVAKKFGFINLGPVNKISSSGFTMAINGHCNSVFVSLCMFVHDFQVGNLKTIYHFQLVMNDTFRQDSEYSFLALSGDDGEWSQIGKVDHITKSLQEDMQGMVSSQNSIVYWPIQPCV